MAESSQKRVENIVEKEKLLITSAFTKLRLQTHKNKDLFGKLSAARQETRTPHAGINALLHLLDFQSIFSIEKGHNCVKIEWCFMPP